MAKIKRRVTDRVLEAEVLDLIESRTCRSIEINDIASSLRKDDFNINVEHIPLCNLLSRMINEGKIILYLDYDLKKITTKIRRK